MAPYSFSLFARLVATLVIGGRSALLTLIRQLQLLIRAGVESIVAGISWVTRLIRPMTGDGGVTCCKCTGMAGYVNLLSNICHFIN